MLEVFFSVFAVLAVLAALLSVKNGRDYLQYVQERMAAADDPDADPYAPKATLILPVRGADHDLAANLRSLGTQDYPDYELIVVCRSESDPAVSAARMTLGENFRLVVSGEPPADTGEKIHNLIAAVSAARRESEVFVFADSDGQARADWLRRLVAPLEEEALGATTAFRWHFPEKGGFWPLLRSLWDAVIAGSMNPKDKNFAWGGATAIHREVFDSAAVADFWRGTVSDDCRLQAALKAAGRGVRFIPEAMVAATGQCSAGEFLDWAVRQLVITRVYRFDLWLPAFLSHAVYCAAMLLSLVQLAAGNLLGLAVLTIVLVAGMAKGSMRSYAAALMFPEREDWLAANGWAYFWMAPIATWVWLYVLVRSSLTRRIAWRGYVYNLIAKDKTERIADAPGTGGGSHAT